MFKRILLRYWYKLIKKTPDQMDMVRYWKTSDHVEAKITTAKDGSTLMVMHGEDYPIQGFPRGHILFGGLSKLKHEIKNQVFNESWRKLEEGQPHEQIITDAMTALGRVLEYMEPLKYDLMPANKMCPAVREIHRAWTKVEQLIDNPAKREKARKIKEILCLILQEDDGYRYRVQFMALWIPLFKWNPVKFLDKGLEMVINAEVIRDMKDRVKLLKRICLLVLEDSEINKLFKAFVKEVNWNKVKLTKGDRYHFRGKYFKVDMDVLEY